MRDKEDASVIGAASDGHIGAAMVHLTCGAKISYKNDGKAMLLTIAADGRTKERITEIIEEERKARKEVETEEFKAMVGIRPLESTLLEISGSKGTTVGKEIVWPATSAASSKAVPLDSRKSKNRRINH